jgi:hypothetical protein
MTGASPYCQQISGYAGWICPVGSVCSIPLGKGSLFWSSLFLWTGWTIQLQIWHGLRSAFYLSTHTKKAWFPSRLAIFDTTPNSRFLGSVWAFSVAYNIKVPLSGYQSIDMHCIVLPVNFDGRLSISVLRNKQLFKKMEVKSSHFDFV